MTPERAECIAWLERNGFTVYERAHKRVFVTRGKTGLAFMSPMQAYRRLGGPDDGRIGSDPKRVGPSAKGAA